MSYPFDHIITKLRTTRGSQFALDTMAEAADRIEELESKVSTLEAERDRLLDERHGPYRCCEHCADDPEYHAENPKDSHDTSCTICDERGRLSRLSAPPADDALTESKPHPAPPSDEDREALTEIVEAAREFVENSGPFIAEDGYPAYRVGDFTRLRAAVLAASGSRGGA